MQKRNVLKRNDSVFTKCFRGLVLRHCLYEQQRVGRLTYLSRVFMGALIRDLHRLSTLNLSDYFPSLQFFITDMSMRSLYLGHL